MPSTKLCLLCFLRFLFSSCLPHNPDRICDESSRGVIHRLGAGNGDSLAERSFQAADRVLLRLYFDAKDWVSVNIICLANDLVGAKARGIRTIVEGSRRREKDKGEDDDANHVVRP